VVERFYSETQMMVGESVRKFALGAVLPVATAIDRDDAFPHPALVGQGSPRIFRATSQVGPAPVRVERTAVR